MIYRKEIENLVPYKPGKPIADVVKEYNLDTVIKLASNENPLGCSPKVVEAIKNNLCSVSTYPDGNCSDLKAEISKKYNISTDNIAVSSGSDEMIDILSKVFIGINDEILLSDITFIRYLDVTKIMGGKPIKVPLKDWKYDLDKMSKSINDKTKLIWLCNPNNPTGTAFSENELINFLNSVPSHIPVVYDEAYSEYASYPKNSLKFLKSYSNLLILKTLSKAYGLASLRVGFTFANSEIIENINKVRGPFNVNHLAQVAAIEALKDEDFLKKTIDLNTRGKHYIYNEFDKLNIEYIKSETNHILFTLNKDGYDVFVELQKLGVIIRHIFDKWVRVSIGNEYENTFFIEKLKKII